MTADELIKHRYTREASSAWDTLIGVYAEVYAERLHLKHYSLSRYAERLARHAEEPGWEAVIAYAGDEPIGYAYVNTLAAEDRWWSRMSPPLPERCTSMPTVALKEGMLRTPWRGTGLARRIHDELLAHRPEEQASLLVNRESGGGKVMALYERWGYHEVSVQQPSPDGPVLTAMLRPVAGLAASR